jgi:hypothetical protein
VGKRTESVCSLFIGKAGVVKSSEFVCSLFIRRAGEGKSAALSKIFFLNQILFKIFY